jgi:hypothetical protein
VCDRPTFGVSQDNAIGSVCGVVFRFSVCVISQQKLGKGG